MDPAITVNLVPMDCFDRFNTQKAGFHLLLS
jgi:hypothetical protein